MKKLLLTSGGITNKSIGNALVEFVDKPASETKVTVIPTAANVEEGNKDWFINQFVNLWQHGFDLVDMVDPSADGVDWKSRLKQTDVIFVSGGNTFHLLNQFRQTGFLEWLLSNLDSRVYVGVSAGSIIMGSSIEVAAIEPADPNLPGLTDLTGLNMVPFNIEPHCNDEARFKIMGDSVAKKATALYAIDDNSAIKVIDNKIEVVSEGNWKLYGNDTEIIAS